MYIELLDLCKQIKNFENEVDISLPLTVPLLI